MNKQAQKQRLLTYILLLLSVFMKKSSLFVSMSYCNSGTLKFASNFD